MQTTRRRVVWMLRANERNKHLPSRNAPGHLVPILPVQNACSQEQDKQPRQRSNSDIQGFPLVFPMANCNKHAQPGAARSSPKIRHRLRLLVPHYHRPLRTSARPAISTLSSLDRPILVLRPSKTKKKRDRGLGSGEGESSAKERQKRSSRLRGENSNMTGCRTARVICGVVSTSITVANYNGDTGQGTQTITETRVRASVRVRENSCVNKRRYDKRVSSTGGGERGRNGGERHVPGQPRWPPLVTGLCRYQDGGYDMCIRCYCCCCGGGGEKPPAKLRGTGERKRAWSGTHHQQEILWSKTETAVIGSGWSLCRGLILYDSRHPYYRIAAAAAAAAAATAAAAGPAPAGAVVEPLYSPQGDG